MQSKWTWNQRREFYNSTQWEHMREYILNRDGYECQMCKADGKVTRRGGLDRFGRPTILEVDHKKELEFYPELRLDPSNLWTLCKDCHNKKHHRFRYSTKHKQHKKNKWSDDERWD